MSFNWLTRSWLTRDWLTRSCLSVAALAIVAASASSAQAQTCRTTVECPQGFLCILPPVPAPTSPPTPACPQGGCPAGTAGANPSGISVPADIAAPMDGYCEPGPCTHDSECGAGMLCHSEEITACTGGTAPAIACAPNTDCPKPTPVPETCTTTTVSQCMYKWQLPCSTDVECGAGFNCMPSVTGSCSGGSGVATPTTGAPAPGFVAPAPPPDMCTTTTSFPGSCQPKATTCAADTDCPASWTCVEVQTRDVGPGVPVSNGSTGSAPASDAKVAPPPATDPANPAPPAPMTTKMCQSPLGTYRGETTVGGHVDGGKTGEGTNGPAPSVPPTTGAPSGAPATDSSSGASPSAGCAVGGAGGPAGFLFVALGLVGMIVARRRK